MKYSLIIIGILICTMTSALETYELRNYRLSSEESARNFDVWMNTAGLADFKGTGVSKVGVFKPRADQEGNANTRFVLLQYDDMSDLRENARMLFRAEQSYPNAEAFLGASKDIPAYDRIETSLLTAFPGFQHLVDPEGNGNGSRYFELRIYESSSERLAALKVEMFCEGGEIEIFNESGLNPVFFGSARIAGNFPQLTYMLVHESQEDADTAWQTFRKSEKWNALNSAPKYMGTVSTINKHLIVALPYSEIR